MQNYNRHLDVYSVNLATYSVYLIFYLVSHQLIKFYNYYR